MAVAMVSVGVYRVIINFRLVLVSVITVDNVGRHEAMNDTRNNLHAQEANAKAQNHKKSSHPLGVAIVDKVIFG